MKPRKNFRSRPKKTGAKKKQRISSQKRRLVAAGQDEKRLDKMTSVEIRNLLKETMKRKRQKSAVKKKTKAKVKVKSKKVKVKSK